MTQISKHLCVDIINHIGGNMLSHHIVINNIQVSKRSRARIDITNHIGENILLHHSHNGSNRCDNILKEIYYHIIHTTEVIDVMKVIHLIIIYPHYQKYSRASVDIINNIDAIYYYINNDTCITTSIIIHTIMKNLIYCFRCDPQLSIKVNTK